MTLSQGKQSNDSKLESTTGASKEYFPCLAGLLTCFHKETSLDFSFFFPFLENMIQREILLSMHYDVRTQVCRSLWFRVFQCYNILMDKTLHKSSPILGRLITGFHIKSSLSDGPHKKVLCSKSQTSPLKKNVYYFSFVLFQLFFLFFLNF